MTDAEKILLVKTMTEETDDDTISAFLSLASEVVYNYADPYGVGDKDDIVGKYGSTQVRVAAYYINKRGADGQITHTENGISRGYEAGDVPASILQEIAPKVGAVK